MSFVQEYALWLCTQEILYAIQMVTVQMNFPV